MGTYNIYTRKRRKLKETNVKMSMGEAWILALTKDVYCKRTKYCEDTQK